MEGNLEVTEIGCLLQYLAIHFKEGCPGRFGFLHCPPDSPLQRFTFYRAVNPRE
ncbi:hypothetical protein MYBA111488_20950 [Mycobacterium basiliense]